MPIALTRPLVICPRCDRDFTVEIRGAGAEPYRESPTVVFTPVYRPPPRGAPVRDTGSRICIVYDGRVSDEITLTRTTIVAAAAAVALSSGEGPRILFAHFTLLMGLLTVVKVMALVVSGRRQDLRIEDGFVAWRAQRGARPRERRAPLADVIGVHLRDGFVEVGLRSGETWAVAGGMRLDAAATAWLARRLRIATVAA